MAQLTNRVDVAARFNDMDSIATSTVVIELGNMNLVKTADKNPWTDGNLTYTITLKNVEASGDITAIVFTDAIDITKSQLITTSVTIAGVPAVPETDFTYDPGSGALRIPYNEPLVPDETVIITFQVRKV